MPIELVLALIPRIVAIVAEEAARFYGLDAPPAPVTSMRTPYKVHLNFPGIVTTETRARRARKAVINRCRAELAGLPPLELLKEEVAAAQAAQRAEREWRELVAEEARLRALAAEVRGAEGGGDGGGGGGRVGGEDGAGAGVSSGSSSMDTSNSSSSFATLSGDEAAAAAAAVQPPTIHPPLDPLLSELDWEGLIDVPHGSLRLPGCYKAPWMDRDPEWVVDKSYSVVEW